MSERKVLSKYYPPDFDPAQLRRQKKDSALVAKLQTVRLMAPFSMKCTTCGEYIYKGRKFNSRKEAQPDEKYLGVQIFRFHIRCTRCSAEITFRTDPKNADYAMVKGALRNMEPWRNRSTAEETDAERLDRLEKEEQEDDQSAEDPMQNLEQKTQDAQHEMAVADALDRIRMDNAARARKSLQDIEETIDTTAQDEQDKQDLLDIEEARRAFEKAKTGATYQVIEEEDMSKSDGSSTVALGRSTEGLGSMAPPPPPVRRAPKKKKKDYSAALGIKKKA